MSRPKPPIRPKRAPSAAPEGPRLRAVPLQERSKKRLDAIILAAAELFADLGYDAVTMDAIAKKAGTPIGSLYQYFDGKAAVFSAVSARSAQRGKEAFDLLVPQLLAHGKRGRPPPFGPALDAMIDGLALLSRSDPMLRASNRNVGHVGPHIADEMAVHRLLIAKSAELLELYAPHSSPAVRELVATTLVDTVTSALVIRELRGREGHRFLEETKRMCRLYATDRLGIR